MGNELVEEKAKIENLYLDPNNPRFADITKRPLMIPPHKIAEQSVQEAALQKILEERFEVKQLKDSILRMGFLQVDRLVVTSLPGNGGRFLVIEGNRRLAAVKDIMRDRASGQIDIPESVLSTMIEIPVLVIAEKDEQLRMGIAKIYQGIRHISGIKPFGPYQQAELIYSMQREGKNLAEIAEILGITTQRANILRRVYSAMMQMRNDEDYVKLVQVNHFSHFEELLKLPKLRDDWAEWDNEVGRFDNTQSIHMFYDWIVGIEDENGQRLPPKISDHKEVRQLRALYEDPVQFKNFCDSPDLDIEAAVNRIVRKEPTLDWRSTLSYQLWVLRQIPAVDFQNPKEEDIKLLNEVLEQLKMHMSMIEKQKAE
jgi:hypothetical protein